MTKRRQRLRFLVLSALLASLLALLCPWVIPMGTVGFTLATMLLATLALSVKMQMALSVTAVYLAIGALGLPVFSHFTGGVSAFASPSGGFLIGYLPFVAIIALSRRHTARPVVTVVAMLAAHTVLYAVGAAVFAIVSDTTFWNALAVAVLPFLLPDAIKAGLSVYAARLLRRHAPLL